jgi:hypothetical protein
MSSFRIPMNLATAAVMAAIGVLLALVPDDWIETVFGFSPDNGNGWAEAALAGVPIATGCLLASDALVAGFRALRSLGGQASASKR